jgi:GTPase SAR1 family protein
MRDQYIRNGHGFLICFAVTNKTSFDECQNFIDAIKKVKDVENVPGILVGCKGDLIEEREVPIQDVLKFSNDNAIPYIETSSKNNIKVDDCFLEVVKIIDKIKKIDESKPKANKNNTKNGGCVVS